MTLIVKAPQPLLQAVERLDLFGPKFPDPIQLFLKFRLG
jgi:hypothetical protein